ncbi:MAG: Sau3AI family type II restriction endonuclease [Coriobacteriia bacterium]
MSPHQHDYDPTDPASIESYAKRLVGQCLRDLLPPDTRTVYQSGTGKGGLGDLVERGYFGINPGNISQPDFTKAGVELKTTPLKRVGKRFRAKERLVLQMIDYDVVCGENWESSSFKSKNDLLLLMFYLWEEGRAPLDYVFKIARLWSIPDEDIEIIRNDWETIVGKVRGGRAHELSEGDTMYLAACTKGSKGSDRRAQPNSDIPAKPRAFAFKASYMNSVIDQSLSMQSAVAPDQLRSGRTFEEIVHDRFRRFIGMSAEEIAAQLDVKVSRNAKAFYHLLTKRILGVDPEKEIAEFVKADIIVRTIRLKPNGVLKEASPFKAFSYLDLVNQTWEDSDLRYDLTHRFLFVLYQIGQDGVARLSRTQFWTPPIRDVEGLAQECFKSTVECVREDRLEYLPKASDNLMCHVRPHGRDSSDKIPTPSGGHAVRRSFWLNQGYMAEQLACREDS